MGMILFGISARLGQMICMICMICMIYSHMIIYIFWGRYIPRSVWSVWSSSCCRMGAILYTLHDLGQSSVLYRSCTAPQEGRLGSRWFIWSVWSVWSVWRVKHLKSEQGVFVVAACSQSTANPHHISHVCPHAGFRSLSSVGSRHFQLAFCSSFRLAVYT